MKNCVTFCRLKFNNDPYWQGDWEWKCQLEKSVWLNLYASQNLVIFIHIGRDYSSTIIAQSQWQETQNIANHLIPKWAWVKLMILRKNWGVYKYFDDSWKRWTTRWNWWWPGRGVRGRNRRQWFHSGRFGTETLRNCERGYLVSKVFDITLLINAIWVIMGYY